MTPIVLDTDVVSFLFKNDSRAESYLSHLAGAAMADIVHDGSRTRTVGASVELAREAD